MTGIVEDCVLRPIDETAYATLTVLEVLHELK
jgi:hypothetical protein